MGAAFGAEARRFVSNLRRFFVGGEGNPWNLGTGYLRRRRQSIDSNRLFAINANPPFAGPAASFLIWPIAAHWVQDWRRRILDISFHLPYRTLSVNTLAYHWTLCIHVTPFASNSMLSLLILTTVAPDTLSPWCAIADPIIADGLSRL